MRLAAAFVLTAFVAGSPVFAQVPNPKLKNPPARLPVATAPAEPIEAQPETREKTQLELIQERQAEREAQAMRSICSNCGGRR